MLGTATAIGLALAAGTTQVLAARREARAAASHPPTGQYIAIDGLRVHVQIMGDGPQDVVLIHGSSGNLRDFTRGLAPELAKRYRVILVDRPGLGWSDPHPHGELLEAQARTIQAVCAHLGADRPIVLGQSYGGAVALIWAVLMPDSLCAVVPVSAVTHPWDTGLGAYYTVLSSPPGQWVVIPMITAFVPEARVDREINATFQPQPAPEGYGEHFGTDFAVRRAPLRENARQRSQLLWQIEAMSKRYDEITVPIELVHGDADVIVPIQVHSQRLADEHPLAQLASLPGIGHMPHHVSIPEIVAAVDRANARAALHERKK